MAPIRPLLSLLLFTGAVLTGCDSDDLEGAVGNLVVTPAERGFFVETVDEYPCSNYPLIIDVDVDGARVTASVEGIGEVEVCATALGPATALIPYPSLDTQPALELVLEKDGATDRYTYDCGVAGCDFAPAGESTFSRTGPR